MTTSAPHKAYQHKRELALPKRYARTSLISWITGPTSPEP